MSLALPVISGPAPRDLPRQMRASAVPQQTLSRRSISSRALLLSGGLFLASRSPGSRQRSRMVVRVTAQVEETTPTDCEEEVLPTKAKLALPSQFGTSAPDGEEKKTKRKFANYLADVERFLEGQVPVEEGSGVPTGWACLNDLYRPVRGEVTVVTGTPGSGKSEWLFSLALDLAKLHSWRFVVVPFEHKQEDWTIQLLEKLHKAPISKLTDIDLPADLEFLARHIQRVGAYSDTLTLEDILERAAYQAEELEHDGGLQGLIIDPYNYIERPAVGKLVSDTQIVSEMMTKLQRFAKTYKTHIWVVVHPTKQSQMSDSEPSLYDCTGSAHWYNKCDNGIYVRRPYAKKQKKKDKRDQVRVGSPYQVDLMVQKVRNFYAGKIGTCKLDFLPMTRGYCEK